MLEIEPYRSPREDCAEKNLNVVTFQRHDIAGKAQQTFSRKEAVKGMGESDFGGSKNVCGARV